jgi:TolB protein
MKYIILILTLTILSCKKEDDEPVIPEQRNDNGIVLNISLSGSLQNPAFSPNNNSIIFTRFINGYNIEPAEIYKFNLITEQLTLLVSDGSGNINLPGASWNNGGIVFASTRDPHDEIYLIPENGQSGDEIQITSRSNKVAYEPTLSPNGEWIVFESHILDIETDGIISKYKVDGSSSYVELTDQGDDCRQPNWSPNDNKILYQRKISGQWNIWIMNTDGTNKTQVTSNLGNCTDASFTTDGQSIIFSSDYQVNIANIYKISIEGTNPIKLTNFNGYDGATSISSDETKLIFESINADPDESNGTKLVMLEL